MSRGSKTKKSQGGGGQAAGSGNGGYLGRVYHVDEYRLVVQEAIAEGGFGVVLLVKSSSGQRFALKRLAVNSEHDLYLARQEIAITRALSDCSNSVTYIASSVHQLSHDVHEVLLLLRHYSGESAIDLLNSHFSRGAALSEQLVLKMFTDVCMAVARLHHRTKPIIHRDLKVENILSDGVRFVLCDYGSCTVRAMHPEVLGAAQCEEEIARCTTLAYRAPEMVSIFSGHSITTKADIWALGCLLYKLCFFTTPFGEHPLAIVSAQFTIPDNSTFSPAMHSLIAYMLQADASKRPDIWQVCQLAFAMRKLPNPVPNVFKSPPPTKTLPPPKRASETKQPVATGSVKKATNHCHGDDPAPQLSNTTPSYNSRNQPVITTTTISSRERPRGSARTTRPSPSSPPLSRAHPHPPPSTSHHPHPPPSTSHLYPPLNSSQCSSKSLDSGLDAFGAVPFTPTTAPPTKATLHSVSNHGNKATTNDIRRDLFGSVPFGEATPPSSQVDTFGAQPFALY